MKLAQRLLLGAVSIVTVLIVVAVVISGERLETQLQRLAENQLANEARFVAQQWETSPEPDALADAAGGALRHRVTLVDSTGRVLGDSEFSGPALAALQNHNDRPEVITARRGGLGASSRISPSEGVEELYVAIDAGAGRIARVSIGTTQLRDIAARARRDLILSGIVALAIAIALAAIFSRQISRPIAELRDVAGAIAAGDLSQRPALSAPGEIGELAIAVHRMQEQLAARMHALQAEDELLGALIEALNEGIFAVDGQRRVIRINRSGRSLLNVDAETPFSVNLLPRDRRLNEALDEALEGHVVDRIETQILGRTLALTARPLGVGGAVLAVFDLTGMRRLETVRRDFVANESHELKTPLTAIRGFAETLAAERSSDPNHAQFAETIRANAERMQRLIDDLLDLSRIESGGWVPTPVTIQVAEAAEEAIAPYRDEAKQRGITIDVSVAANASNLRADPVALRQALGNLIENAIRYTPRGGKIVVFSRRHESLVAIGVEDSGSGIPPEHLPRIFERFYRVDPARSRAAGGTGLGLAIVKHLVEAHGGRVRAESQLGRGTTVSLFFPTA